MVQRRLALEAISACVGPGLAAAEHSFRDQFFPGVVLT